MKIDLDPKDVLCLIGLTSEVASRDPLWLKLFALAAQNIAPAKVWSLIVHANDPGFAERMHKIVSAMNAAMPAERETA